MKTFIFFVLMLAVPVLLGSSDAPLQASVLPESQVSITGSSTLSRFECVAGSVQGAGLFENGRASALVTVPVDAFNCGNSRMNRDLRDAMEAADHPEIRFEMKNARRVGSGLGNADRLLVEGRLTIAGATRAVEIEAFAERQPDGKYRVRGRDELLMSDFGINPPTALAGLIRAHDRIVVHFDLLAATHIRNNDGASPSAASSWRER